MSCRGNQFLILANLPEFPFALGLRNSRTEMTAEVLRSSGSNK